MTWTPERAALAARLWSEGYSAAHIARELGDVSRNAVCGKMWRANGGRCDRRGKRKPSVRRAPRITDKLLAQRVARRALERIRSPKIRAGKITMPPPPPVAPLDIPFLERRPSQCVAITDATRYAQRCCGHPVAGEGQSYCPWHKRLHAQPGKAR